jgi:hypothetical protein
MSLRANIAYDGIKPQAISCNSHKQLSNDLTTEKLHSWYGIV